MREEYEEWFDRMHDEDITPDPDSHEQRMRRLHEVSQERLQCNSLGGIECTCSGTWREPRGEGGDWSAWEVELKDQDHNALLDKFAQAC